MASTRRRSDTSLTNAIFEDPQSFDIFQAIRVLEGLAAAEARQTGQPLDPVGRNISPASAPLKIKASVPLAFAATEVTSVRRPRNGEPVELTQTVIGLTGPSGVLPHSLSELVQVSVRERNPALREFLDLFNNRLAALLFEAWAKTRIEIERERAANVGTPQPIDHALRAIVGLAFDATSDRTNVPDSTSVFFGGLLSRQGRSVTAVENVMSGALGHVVEVEQFRGEWVAIATSDRTRLPSQDERDGAFARLGHDAIIGAHAYDVQSSVMIRVGPLSYGHFRSLLPDGMRATLLTDLAAQALGPDKTFLVGLRLLPDEVPPLRLEPDQNSPTASRLGWNTWLLADSPRREPASAEFRPLPHLR